MAHPSLASNGPSPPPARDERSGDPQPFHHPHDRLPDRLQHLSADLFAGLFLHRFPRIDQRACELRGASELPRSAVGRIHLAQLHHHREVCADLGQRAGDRRLRCGDAAEPRHPLQGISHHAAVAADDAVDGSGGVVLETALRSFLRHHQLCVGPGHLRVVGQSRHGALRHRAGRHLDVVALRDAAVAGGPFGRAQASL